MDNQLVSIITPVYNAEKFLDDCIQSIVNQSFTNWELWLVDDCSTDGSKKIIESWCNTDKRIHSILFEANRGTAAARNAAINKSTGDFIAFLDADDLWKPNKLEKQVDFMITNQFAFTYTYYEWIDESGKPMNKIIKARDTVNYHQLLKFNDIGCLTAMYDTHRLGKQLMPPIRKRQDYGLWLQLLRSGEIAHCLNENLASYRVTASSLSNNKLNVIKYNWELLRKHEGLGFLSASWYFGCFLFNKLFKYIK